MLHHNLKPIMKDPKTPKTETAFSINHLAELLKRDRRTINRALEGVEPDRTEGKRKFYRLSTVHAQLAARVVTDPKLRDQKLIEEIRKLKIANDAREGRLIPLALVSQQLHELASGQLKVLRQKLEAEYPTAVAGMDPAQARVYGKRLVDDICASMRGLVEKWKD